MKMKISCLHRAMKVSWQGSTTLCVSLTGPWLHSDHSNEEVSFEAVIQVSQSELKNLVNCVQYWLLLIPKPREISDCFYEGVTFNS